MKNNCENYTEIEKLVENAAGVSQIVVSEDRIENCKEIKFWV